MGKMVNSRLFGSWAATILQKIKIKKVLSILNLNLPQIKYLTKLNNEILKMSFFWNISKMVF